MKLTPDDFARIEAKRLATVLRKVQSGKPLTAREEALLAQAKVGGAGDAASAFAPTWDELARRLNTTRRSLQEWRKDPRYAPDCPHAEADGRLDVAKFAEWMIRHGLNRADERVSDVDEDDTVGEKVVHPPRLGGSQSDWTKAVLQEKHASAKLDRETKEGTLLVAADLEIPLGTALAAIQTKLAQFPATASRIVAGRRDVAEVEDLLRSEMDIILGELHAAAYLDTLPADVAAAIPFDEESERLLALVTFEGQDRAAMLQLVAHLAGECLRRIGRRALAPASSEILDSKTGQVTDEAAARSSAERASSVAAASAHAEAAPSPRRKARRKTEPSKIGRSAKRKRRAAPTPAAPPADVEAIGQVASPKRRRVKRRRK